VPPSADPYDALLLVSFGGPERPEDVIAFLENVTRGRGVPRERLDEVAEHYFQLGGRSPINDQCRDLIRAVEADLAAQGVEVPVYWGNRNWDPFLTDTVAKMRADGVRAAAAFVTSAYSSYSGCRQYREDLFRAAAATPDAPRIDRLRHYFNHPGFVDAFADTTRDAIGRLPEDVRAEVRIVFVTHSIPMSMAATAGPEGGAYEAQHRSAAALVARSAAVRTGVSGDWDLAYCSRSGPPQVAWLEPDVNDHLERLADDGARAVVVVPLGFVSDHMEVVYDLDTEAASTAKRLGLAFARAATPGVHPAFVGVVGQLLLERAAAERGKPVTRAAVGDLAAVWDVCGSECCPNPRQALPALCESVDGPRWA
jgi:protoporphyrin/coproporphyrin ferrochelatase